MSMILGAMTRRGGRCEYTSPPASSSNFGKVTPQMKTRVILVCGWALALGALVSPAAAQPLLAEPSGPSVLGPEGSFRARLAGPRRAERLRRGGLSERARAAAALGHRG